MTPLSKNFSLEELTVTGSGISNVPDQSQRVNLTELVQNVLQPLREKFGRPIKINSGFRSASVNKHVGGVASSQHCTGEAADIDSADNAKLFDLIRANFVFDQLIWEKGNDHQPAWVHVSYKTQGNRGEVLRLENGKYRRL